MPGYNPNCSNCIQYVDCAAYPTCALHGHKIPRIGVEVVCSDYTDSRDGLALGEIDSSLLKRLRKGELYSYARPGVLVRLGDFKDIVFPVVGAMAPVSALEPAGSSEIWIRPGMEAVLGTAGADNRGRIEIIGAGTSTNGFLNGVDERGRTCLKLTDTQFLSKFISYWFDVKAIRDAMKKRARLKQALGGGIPVTVELKSDREFWLRPNSTITDLVFKGMTRRAAADMSD